MPVRRSYLFVVDATEKNIDKLIEYAKIGRFGMIILLKENWLANHGHFQVNLENFFEGRASLKRAVAKIHAAGLGVAFTCSDPRSRPTIPTSLPNPTTGWPLCLVRHWPKRWTRIRPHSP